MSEETLIRETVNTPATVTSLVSDLTRLGVTAGSTLIVHSSLRSMGWVCGGPVAVIQALQHVVGSSGTLVMPTQSAGLSDPANWENPPVPEAWWPIIYSSMPAYDPRLTPTRGMGAVPECFRNMPHVLRSAHPHLSFSACGPAAPQITQEHSLEDGLGDSSPLGRLYQLDAWILLIGVTHESNTSLHLAQSRADDGSRKRIRNGAPLMVDGQRQWVAFDEPQLDVDHFNEIGRGFQIQTGRVRQGLLGQADSLLMPQRELIDFAEQWLTRQ